MHARVWKVAVVIGVLIGLVVSSVMTFMDWRLNPAGIFHNEAGTDWEVVTETALSWLWPVALATCLTAAVGLYAVAWIRSGRSN